MSRIDGVESLRYSLLPPLQSQESSFSALRQGICMEYQGTSASPRLTLHSAVLYIGRLVSGLGVGAASMLTPLYVSENAPRAIRGALTGMYQLFIATGTMLSFWVNYGAILHLKGDTVWVAYLHECVEDNASLTHSQPVPLACQMIPAIFLFVGIAMCNESPRWLARQDNWEKATAILSKVSNHPKLKSILTSESLPSDHPYIRMEIEERRLIGGAGFVDLMKEMWLVAGNRKRALISIGLMICQQMTGTNAINYYAPKIFLNLGIDVWSNSPIRAQHQVS
ncbi:general substrate transporter protein [Rutstroemia sp. NJR-2017a BBW]|nr:general substrate transporter protein [Rutstroemia sp. NJR-2017a BBW]